MSKLTFRFFFALFLLLAIVCVFSFTQINIVRAQIPRPTVKCDEVRPSFPFHPLEEEYHSLRPYQASPCVTYATSSATFCGNNLTVKDIIEVEYPGSEYDSCTKTDNKVYCDYTVEVDKKIAISLENADLPIMGNTGDEGEVINYHNSKEGLSDADKVNEYVSWYLQGVTNKKEYPKRTDDVSIVNYSGLIAKITPKQIQEAERVKNIENAIGKSLSTGRQNVEQNRHNQVVVCTRFAKPVKCNGIIDTEWRLEKWSNNFPFATIEGWVIERFANMIPEWLQIGNAKIKEMIRAGEPWNHKYPPLPWSPEILNNQSGYNKNMLYKKAYSEWQGNFCLIVPVINQLLCVNNPLVADKYAELFPYVSMSSTEDTEGEIMIEENSSVSGLTPNGTVVTDITFSDQKPSSIYLSHMEETDQLGSLLQSTFVPANQDKIGDPTEIEEGSACFSAEVRSNPGDDLFATQIEGMLGYTAQFSCEYEKEPNQSELERCPGNNGLCVPNSWSCASLPNGGCKEGFKCGGYGMCQPPTQICTNDVYISMSTQTKIPLLDDIWSRLVAGPMSVFKRIFPKTNTEGSVGQIIDIPGSTNITYSGTNVDVTSANTDLKLPHIGGISEYFLKGIQTALRPKGYGDAIKFGGSANYPGGEIDCDQNAPDISSRVPKIITKEALHELAIRWEGREGDHVLECYNDAVGRSLAAGINPAFTLLIWINESGGSNYDISWQDFGINSSEYLGFSAQINGFLDLPEFYRTDPRWSSCFGKGHDTEMFFSVYYTGQCNINDLKPGHQYILLIKLAWNWFTSCNFPGFPFKATCY